MADQDRGFYKKYKVTRLNNDIQGKHDECEYFVLDLGHDRFAGAALRAYADACEAEFPLLAKDLRARFPSPASAPAPQTEGKRDHCKVCRRAVMPQDFAPDEEVICLDCASTAPGAPSPGDKKKESMP